MKQHEFEFLNYCERVIRCWTNHPGHYSFCEKTRYNGELNGGVNSKVRFPGYVGSRYVPGRGILLVGAIHNLNKLYNPPINKLEEAMLAWLAGSRNNDHNFLTALQTHYPAAIGYWKSNYTWSYLTEIVKRFDLTLDDVAFTNLAKCANVGGTDDELIRRCVQDYKIDEVSDILKPAMVFVSKLSPTSVGVFDWGQHKPPVKKFHGHSSQAARNVNNETFDVWILRAKKEYNQIVAKTGKPSNTDRLGS